ncbi:MAG: dockerin type I domain-containing protein [Patescibacteria group bacterium]
MKKIKKVVLAILFLGMLITPNVSSASTLEELTALLNSLLAQVQTLQQQIAQQAQAKSVAWCHNFDTNLKYGDSGEEITALQTVLEKQGLYKKGTNPPHFDEQVASAVSGFQMKYKKVTLDPWGLQYGTGFVGKTTREKLNQLYGCGNLSTPVVPTPTPTPTSPITVLSPNGGENFELGGSMDVKWNFLGNIDRVIIDILDKNGKAVYTEGPISYEIKGGGASYSWFIPSDFLPGSYRVKIGVCPPNLSDIECANSVLTIYDKSDNYFNVTGAVITLPTSCTDSDNGKDYYVKGSCIDSNGNKNWDACFGIQVTETFCAENLGCGYIDFKCPNGCQDGACVEAVENHFSISLQKGWNLISLPVEPINSNIAEVLKSIEGKYDYVKSFDNGALTFTLGSSWSNLKTVHAGQGLEIKMKENATLKISGNPPVSNTFNFQEGWNLFGIKSSGSQQVTNIVPAKNIVSLYRYKSGADSWGENDKEFYPADFTSLESGRGYWLKYEKDAVIGDVNENGRLDIGDSQFISQYLAGNRNLTEAQLAKADINGDGKVTEIDADLIAQILVGNITLDEALNYVEKPTQEVIMKTENINQMASVLESAKGTLLQMLNSF